MLNIIIRKFAEFLTRFEARNFSICRSPGDQILRARFRGATRNSHFRKLICRRRVRSKFPGQGNFPRFDNSRFLYCSLDNEYKSILYYSGTSLKLGVLSSPVLLSRNLSLPVSFILILLSRQMFIAASSPSVSPMLGNYVTYRIAPRVRTLINNILLASLSSSSLSSSSLSTKLHSYGAGTLIFDYNAVIQLVLRHHRCSTSIVVAAHFSLQHASHLHANTVLATTFAR